MKYRTWLLAGLLTLVLPLCACRSTMPVHSEPVDVAVEHLLWAIDEAAAQSYAKFHDQLDFELSSIEVALETIVETTNTGEVTVLVVTLDGSREDTFTQIVTVDLEPPKVEAHRPSWPRSPHPTLVGDLVKGFDAAILAAQGVRNGLQKLEGPSGDGASDKATNNYKTDDIAVELEFALTWTVEGSATIEILNVDLTLGHTRVKENVHTVKLVFKPASADSSKDAKADDEDEADGESKARDRRHERDG